MAEEALARIGTMLEEIGARFDLVVEAVSGFEGGLEKLREEMIGQFSEVGNQIRFLSDQIAENRAGVSSLHAELGAEMVRLGEMIGRTRVEFRQQLAATESSLKSQIAPATGSSVEAGAAQVGEPESGDAIRAPRRIRAETGIGRELAASIRELRREVKASSEATSRKLGGDIKQTNKTIAALARKFERFDDRMTVQVRDQDQRLRKIERRGRG